MPQTEFLHAGSECFLADRGRVRLGNNLSLFLFSQKSLGYIHGASQNAGSLIHSWLWDGRV